MRGRRRRRRILQALLVLISGVGLDAETDTLLKSLRRRLTVGANCVTAGGGSVVSFESCFGCSSRLAWACVSDMRLNTTGSVPKGCRIEAISLVGKPSCCPQFVYPNKPATINKYTAAYPEALTCLIDVGCVGSEAWHMVKNECQQNRCTSKWACRELQSPASPRVTSGYAVAAICTLVAVVAMQLLTDL